MQPDVKTVVAEPSAAAVVPEFNPADQYTWSPEQREHWNQTGKLPEPPKKEESAASDAPKAAKPEGDKPETAAEPGAAPTQEKVRKPGGKPTAEERIQELTAERRILEEKLRKIEAAAVPPTKIDPPKPEPLKLETPKKPAWNDFKDKENGWEEYEAAKDTYYDEKAKHEARLAVDQDRQERARAETNARLQSQLKEARDRYPDAEAVIIPAVSEILSNESIHPVLKGLIDSSPVLLDLMYELGSGEKKALAEFVQLAKSDPYQAVRYLVSHEQLVKEQLSKPQSKEVKPEPKSEKAEPPVEVKPRAPKPLESVGGRDAALEPADRAAARDNDAKAFDQAMRSRYFSAS